MYTTTKVYEKLGVYPNQIVEYKSLIGDKSDNITGIRGVGPKTAQRILSYGNINEIVQNGCKDEKAYGILKENEAIINRNVKLISMKRDIPITFDLSQSIKEINTYARVMDIIKASGV
jgi:DNA polymerase-1